MWFIPLRRSQIEIMDIITKILTGLKVELSDEFDRNFERKAFFSKKWKARRHAGNGSLLVETGKLRRSIRARVSNKSVVFTTSETYAAIHNDGGTITVTAKMHRFFWAQYYKAAGKIRHSKTGASRGALRLSKEAEMWRNMALMKIGSKIVIPQRQFLGDSPEVHKAVEDVISDNLNVIKTAFKRTLNK